MHYYNILSISIYMLDIKIIDNRTLSYYREAGVLFIYIYWSKLSEPII